MLREDIELTHKSSIITVSESRWLREFDCKKN